MTRWNESRITATAILLQACYVILVVAGGMFLPQLTDQAGMTGEVGGGPSFFTSLLLWGGAVSGLVVGVLLSRLPVGYAWDRDGFSAFDAGLYAAIAAVAGTFGAFVLITVVQIATVWVATGVFAPLVVGVASGMQFGSYVIFGTVSGFFVGSVVFLGGGVLVDLFWSAQPDRP